MAITFLLLVDPNSIQYSLVIVVLQVLFSLAYFEFQPKPWNGKLNKMDQTFENYENQNVLDSISHIEAFSIKDNATEMGLE